MQHLHGQDAARSAPGPSPDAIARAEHRRLRARSLGGLFAAGGTLSAVVVLLPGWPEMQQVPIFLLAALAVAGGGVLWRWGHRFSTVGVSAFLAFGTAIIAAAQYLAGGGGASASYAMLYVWVALYAAMSFRPHVVALHLAGTVLAHGAVLVRMAEVGSMSSRVALTLGTQIAASVVVGRMAAHLRTIAETDHLTGLPNRRRAARALTRSTAPGRRSRREVAVAVLDLNGFKAINDRLGHAAGDAMLVGAARAWSTALEPSWTLARTGGDEFLLVVPEPGGASLDDALGRLRAAAPDVDFSAGTAVWDGDESVDVLLDRADRALYAAKQAGTAARVPFSP